MSSVFTDFSKGISGSIGLSFSESASEACDKGCRLWDACYATRIERMYTGYRAKLARHRRRGPISVVREAIRTLPDRHIPWARLSVSGSLPACKDMSAKRWRIFGNDLRQFVIESLGKGALFHIPVESTRKARSYRAMLKGLKVVVRRTSQAPTIEKLVGESDIRSWVAASRIHKGCVTKQEVTANIALARAVASRIRESGESCVVCPAIAGSSKCGKCTACASACVDVVIYPFHP